MRKRYQNLAVFGMLFGTTLVLHAQCHFAKSTASRTLTYRFQPEATQDGLVLHVTLALNAGANGIVTLELPTHWAGETLHAMTNLHALSSEAVLDDGPDADTRIVHAPANHRVLIGYDLKKDWVGGLVHPLQFHPVLMPEYLEFTGSNALVAPEIAEAARETVNFDWQKLPESWTLATSFGTSATEADRCQSYTGPWIIPARRASLIDPILALRQD